MAFMVKNPGLMPGMDSIKAGDVGRRRKGMWDVILGGWRACIEPGDGTTGYAPALSGDGMFTGSKPFIADAIIANPPSFGHIHCAEKLGCPLHIMFTMPWSATQAFPHPLANIQSTDAENSVTNLLSYALVEMMTWQGLGDLVNRFRVKTLGLDPITSVWAPGMMSRLKVPYTYCWSPALIPKPRDWPSRINISGFFFLSLANTYSPPPDLAAFLAAGPPPVYIGFGSIVVDDPNALTELILTAVRAAGHRALISKGWGGIGSDDLDIPEGVMLLDNCPHDWLFPRCAAVVHHGGAGTTAAGIKAGRPTMIVPFFGDQSFWGSMVARAGAGPEPVPHRKLTAENLEFGIRRALAPEMRARAEALGERIRGEDGAGNGAKAFHTALGPDFARCELFPDRTAVWSVKGSDIKLSCMAASILVQKNALAGGYAGLRLHRNREWVTDEGPWEPVTGAAGALIGTAIDMGLGVGDIPMEAFRAFFRKKSKYDESAPELERIAKWKDDRKSVSMDALPMGESAQPGSVPGSVHGSVPGSPRSTGSLEHVRTEPSSPITSAGFTSEPGSIAGSIAGIERTATEGTTSSAGTGSSSRKDSKGKGKEAAAGTKGKDSLNAAMGSAKGLGRIAAAGMKSPMEFSLGIAQGFRNAPRIYGDTTVRPQEKITGIQSGIFVAGKELTLGLYDGISGLVTQPYRGAKQEGALGFVKGTGKGVAGVFLKSGAGLWGIPGYAMKGVHRELRKLTTPNVAAYIASARIAQGEMELLDAGDSVNHNETVKRWYALRSSRGARRWFSTDKAKAKAKKRLSKLAEAPPEEFEAAIRESVAATSTGDARDDAVVERAVRASVQELQREVQDGTDEFDEEAAVAAVERAVAVGLAERYSFHAVDEATGDEDPEAVPPNYEEFENQIAAAYGQGLISTTYPRPANGESSRAAASASAPAASAGPATQFYGDAKRPLEELREEHEEHQIQQLQDHVPAPDYVEEPSPSSETARPQTPPPPHESAHESTLALRDPTAVTGSPRSTMAIRAPTPTNEREDELVSPIDEPSAATQEQHMATTSLPPAESDAEADAELRRAMEESVRHEAEQQARTASADDDEAALAEAMRMSMLPPPPAEEEDEEALKKAMEESLRAEEQARHRMSMIPTTEADDEDAVRMAMEESLKAEAEEERRRAQEEEIVLKHVMRMSVLEEEMSRKRREQAYAAG